MSKTLQESWQSFTNLKTRMQKSSERTQKLKNYLINIQHSMELYAKKLMDHTEAFSREISNDNDEHDLFYYNYLCHFMLNISHQNMLTATNIQNKILEPFELFVENFKETNLNLLKNANRILTNIDITQTELGKKQELYYHYSMRYEEYQKENDSLFKRIEKGEVTKDDLAYYTYDTMNFKNAIDKAVIDYKNVVNTLNQKWEQYDHEFFAIFENFDINEESRINFIKSNVTQVLRSFNELHNDIINIFGDYNSTNFEKKAEEIEQKLEKKLLYITKNPTKENSNNLNKFAKKIEFISYENYRRILNKNKDDSNKENILPNNIESSEKQSLDNIINILLQDSSSSMTTFNSVNSWQNQENEYSIESRVDEGYSNCHKLLSNIFLNISSRKYFLEKLCQNRVNEIRIDHENWNLLKQIANLLIQNIHTTQEKDPEMFNNLIQFLNKFYKEEKFLNKKRFLCSEFRLSFIWEDLSKWENLANYILYKKKLEENLKSTPRSRSFTNDFGQPFSQVKGLISGFFGYGKKSTSSSLPESTTIPINNNPIILTNDTLKLQVLEEINTFVFQMELNPALSLKILQNIANKFEMQNKSFRHLKKQIEMKSNAILRKQLQTSSTHHERKFKKLGNLLAIKLSLSFLSSHDDPLLNILLVCKEWKNHFEKEIYKIALIKANQDINLEYRLNLWLSIIKLDKIDLNYLQIKETYNKLREKTCYPIEDIIRLDVQRSFHNHPNISSMILNGLLRLYAHCNPDVSYCQGMNFIMGYLYCLYQNEEITFKFFVAIMDKFLKRLLINDLTHLKLVFYQYDRLISIFLPELAEHFEKENIEASLYTSPWFITVFTSVFQFTQLSFTLFKIWDIFLLEGWKGFFKVIMVILHIFQEDLLKSRFDEILSFMNDLVKHEIFSNQYLPHTQGKNKSRFSLNSKDLTTINNSFINDHSCNNANIVDEEKNTIDTKIMDEIDYSNNDNQLKMRRFPEKLRDILGNIDHFTQYMLKFNITNELLEKLEYEYSTIGNSLITDLNLEIQTKNFGKNAY